MGTLSSIGLFVLSVVWSISFSNASVSKAENQVPIIPSPPDVLNMQDPLSSSGYNSTPTVRVGGVAFGDIVILYTGLNCRTEVGVAVATGSFVDVTVGSALSSGDYSFFAQIDRFGVTSACSSTFTEYSLVEIDSPTLLGYGVGELHNASPTIEVGGAANGDVVELFSDSACSLGLGTATASGPSVEFVVTPALLPGTYSFYAQTTRGEGRSQCSLILADYEVTVTVPDAPSALSLSSPAGSPGDSATPVIIVDGVNAGDTIMLFTNPSCGTSVDALGINVAQGNSVDVGVSFLSPLEPGSYTFYARADRNGVLSECSSASVDYEFLAGGPSAPSALSMSNPAAGSGVNAIPRVRVEGVNTGDLVLIFPTASCGELEEAIGLGFAGEGPAVNALGVSTFGCGKLHLLRAQSDDARREFRLFNGECGLRSGE